MITGDTPRFGSDFPRRLWFRFSLAIAAALVPWAAAWGQSDDAVPAIGTQVWHQPPPRSSGASEWLPQPIIHTVGEVVEFAGDRLQIRSGSGEEEEVTDIAAGRVVWIEPAWSDDSARQGMEDFQAGRYAEAIPHLLQAIQARPPVWQQQWLTAHMAMAAAETDRYPAALELVGQLARSGAPTPMLALLPIDWTARPISASAVAAARERIQAAEPAVRLVAASWMLGTAADRATAERTLHALSIDSQHPWIAQLAEAVRWRRTPVPRIEDAATQWLESIDQLPIGLQGGPLLCAADRLAAAGLSDRADELYRAIALLHQRPRPIADQARAAVGLK